MTPNEAQLKTLFQSHFNPSVTQIDSDMISRIRRDSLLNIYKRNKKNSWIAVAAVYLLFAAKKVGISLSVFQCYLLVAIVPAVLVIGISVGSGYAIRSHMHKSELPVEPTVSAFKAAPENIPIVGKQVEYRIRVSTFRHDGFSAPVAEKLKTALYTELIRLKGKGFAGLDGNNSSSSDILTGSVIRTDQRYTVSIKLTDGNAKVILFKQESFTDEAEIESLTRKIAESVIHY